jgi:membrane-associated phospholipid phosphatase
LSDILSAHTNSFLDILAWIPYGLGHFALPAICSALMFLFAAPGTTPAFARAFGFMSLLGVAIQLTLPCTPPWYEKANGLTPAHYGMPGSPAGLARVDALLGVDMYTTSFSTAPLPFGAFPSLHSADAILEALFMQHCFPRLRPLFVVYVVWIWWATMYLNHHYAVDLVGGGLIAFATYYIVRCNWLPRPQLDKTFRWEYEYVEIGDRQRRKARDEEYGAYGLARLDDLDDDSWSKRGSSSFDSARSAGSTSASASASGGSSPGSLSPAMPDDDFRRHVVLGMTAQGEIWEGGRVGRESDLADVVIMG